MDENLHYSVQKIQTLSRSGKVCGVGGGLGGVLSYLKVAAAAV